MGELFQDLIAAIESRRAAMNAKFDQAIAALRAAGQAAGATNGQQPSLPGVAGGTIAPPTAPARGPALVPGSLVTRTIDILRTEGKALHINHLVPKLGTTKQTLFGSLDRGVKQQKVLTKPQPGTYGLPEWGKNAMAAPPATREENQNRPTT